MSQLLPCILERKIVPTVWGGTGLGDALGIELKSDKPVGETWEVFDRPDGSNAIRGSQQTLRDLMLADSTALLGRGVAPTPQGYFPLLLKFIDAAKPLSVQVHPSDALAKELKEPDTGKTEAWVMLGASEEGRIILGTKPGVTTEQFAAVAHQPGVEGLLHKFRPEPGEAIFVPPGTVHAIGPGVMLFEIQQNSDLTYRLYDWGRPRETHVEKGLKAIREAEQAAAPFGRMEPEPIRSASPGVVGDWLFRNEYFSLRRFKLSAPATIGTEGSFKLATVVAGAGTLGWRSGGEDAPLTLQSGDTVLIPACVSVVFLSPVGEMEVFWSAPGER